MEKKKFVTEQATSPWILKKKTTNGKPTTNPTSSPRQAQQITDDSKPTDSQKKKKKKTKPNQTKQTKTQYVEIRNHGQHNQTLIDVETWKKERNLT